MKKIRLFLRSVRYSRPRQLAWRLLLTWKRSLAVMLGQVGLLPGWWRWPAPTLRDREPLVMGPPEIQTSRRSIPTLLNLVGTPHRLGEETEWNAPALNRGTRLEKLNLHYMEYLRELEPEAVGRVLLDWARNNPPCREEYWKDSWNSYALSIRVVEWMRALSFSDLRLTAPDRVEIHLSLARQLRFLRRNIEYDITGNHIIRNIRALLFGASFFYGKEADEWRTQAIALLERELPEQILDDGMHFEMSPAYHLQVFWDLLDCHALVDEEVMPDLAARLDAMAQVVKDLTHPDGLPSLFNDGGLHMSRPPAAALEFYARLREKDVRTREVGLLSAAGYAFGRFGEDLVILDCGRVGADHLPAHAHGDVFSFEWTVAGRRLVVDAGVTEYHAGELRRRSRATSSHNTVTLDDQDQGEFWAAFRLGRRPKVRVHHFEPIPDGGFRFEGSHSGYAHLRGAPVHERTFVARRDAVQVSDEVFGGDGQVAVARILLAPDVSLEVDGRSATLKQQGTVVDVAASSGIRVDEALWMPDFGVRLPTRQLVMPLGTAPCRGEFTLRLRDRGS